MAEPVDLAAALARFGAALRAGGLAAGPDRTERFARAVTLVRPGGTRELYWCALATLVSDPGDVPVLDRVFQLVFGGLADVAPSRGQAGAPPVAPSPAPPPPPARSPHPAGGPPAGAGPPDAADRGSSGVQAGRESPVPVLAVAAERLAGRDFAELSTQELAELAAAMRRLRLAPPARRVRRTALGSRGPTVDLRATLRQAGRTAGDPLRLRRRRPRHRPRRLVVLCDVSGSMVPYARAMLQLLYCAAGGPRAEVFTFATRLTRLTRVLARAAPAAAWQRAGAAVPDWSGGTRIGAALKEFRGRYGARGMARGAVVLIVSDGWEAGEPGVVGREMTRLSRLAYRIVWANPRTRSPRFRPLTGGMAAAWPYCDAVVSAHDVRALDELCAALADPVRRRRRGTAGNLEGV
jgi:uncharacterized protein with von Willebrand factor type A (vWA) domain